MQKSLSLSILLLTTLTAAAHASNLAPFSTFENYSEGSLGSAFTDPTTNIHYLSPVGGTFFADYATNLGSGVSLPPVTPGTYISGYGFTPGNGGQIGGEFGFAAIFPSTSSTVVMDVIYEAGIGAQLDFTAFSLVGDRVLDVTYPLPSNPLGIGLREAHVEFDSSTPIKEFSVSADVAIGYDNVGAPEPSSIVTLLLSTLLFHKSRNRRIRPRSSHF